MSLKQYVLTMTFILLVQNLIFENFADYYGFLNYKNYKKNFIKLFLVNIIIVLFYAFIANSVISFLNEYELQNILIICISFLIVIVLQISEIIYKNLSFAISLNEDDYIYIIKVCTVQMSFCSLLIQNGFEVSYVIIFSLITSFLYHFICWIFSYLNIEIQRKNMFDFAKGFTIKLITISIFIFVLFELL